MSDSVKRYGYEPEELLGTNVMKIVYPEDKAKTIHRIKERRTGVRSTKSFETRLITKRQMPVSFEVFIISAEGLYSPSEAGLKSGKLSNQKLIGYFDGCYVIVRIFQDLEGKN